MIIIVYIYFWLKLKFIYILFISESYLLVYFMNYIRFFFLCNLILIVVILN